MTITMTSIERLRGNDAEMTARVTALGLHGMARAAMRIPFAVVLPLTPEMEEMIGRNIKAATRKVNPDPADENRREALKNQSRSKTDARDKRALVAVDLIGKGMPVSDICQIIGSKKETVTNYLLDHGIATDEASRAKLDRLSFVAKAVRQGIPIKEAARDVKINFKQACRYLKNVREKG